MSEAVKVRLDKWLWAARFYKTRQLAIDAVNGGKVHLNGQRTKPGKEVKIGAVIKIKKGGLEWDIVVVGFSKQRRPAKEAVLLYIESEESQQKRNAATAIKREQRKTMKYDTGRPTKKDRRLIHKFITNSDD